MIVGGSRESLLRSVSLLDAHSDIAVLCGRIVLEPSGEDDPVCRVMAESPLPSPPSFPGTRLLGFVAGASVVRADAFLAVGGFDARFQVGGEEDILAWDLAAAGWLTAYAPDVVVHHQPSGRRDLSTRERRETRNALWAAWLRLPRRDALRHTGSNVRHAIRNRNRRLGVLDAARAAPE